MGRLTVAASLGQAAWGLRRQWSALPPERRDRLQALVRKSGGRPTRLSAAERQELQGLVVDLDLGGVLRESVMRAGGGGFRRRD